VQLHVHNSNAPLFILLMLCACSFADRSVPNVDDGHSEVDSVIVQIMLSLLFRCFEACVGLRGYGQADGLQASYSEILTEPFYLANTV
jgi:hypothetical protein